jgi:hypothetical protein
MSRLRIAFAALAFALFGVTACYNVTTIDLTNDVTIDREVSFATDIVPIFEQNCSVSGCHVSGGQKPDLTKSQALASLSSGNYLDLNLPENSELYAWLTGKRSAVMPLSGSDPEINAFVLAWITQGAQNN